MCFRLFLFILGISAIIPKPQKDHFFFAYIFFKVLYTTRLLTLVIFEICDHAVQC